MDVSQAKDVVQSFFHDQPYLTAVLFALGCLSALKVIYQTLSVILQTAVLPGVSLTKFGAKKGAWAIVTGATDGIGKEFALQLGKAGFNVLLVARNKSLLSSVAGEIEKKYKVSTSTHSIDYGKAGDTEYAALAKIVGGMDIGVLVNNVGKSHNMPAYLTDTPQDEITDIISININGTIRTTYAALPGMVQRKRGLIINIGSFSGAVPSPMLATYSGSKAFITTFSAALGEEVKKHGIIVENVNTYFVVSKLSKIRKSSLFIPTPGPYVRSVLSKVGLACGAAYSGRPNTTTPYWSHALLDYAIHFVNAPSLFIRYTHNLHKDIRRRALRKQERDAKAQ